MSSSDNHPNPSAEAANSSRPSQSAETSASGEPKLSVEALNLSNQQFAKQVHEFVEVGVLTHEDVALIDTVAPRWGETRADVLLAFALAWRAPRQGHVGVDLSTMAEQISAEFEGRRSGENDKDPTEVVKGLPWPQNPEEWLDHVLESPMVSKRFDIDASVPFIAQTLRESTLLMTHRMATEQQRVANALIELAKGAPNVELTTSMNSTTERLLFPPTKPQEATGKSSDNSAKLRIAAKHIAHASLLLITGGPGTGKTFSVSRILLSLMLKLPPDVAPLRIALAAPTGKAAVRMREAISENLSNKTVAALVEQLPEDRRDQLAKLEAKTLHSLLGIAPNGTVRRNSTYPVPADIIVVDEVSMVDVVTMRMLLEAVPRGARLILLGDPDQLASVEAGSVLADVVTAAKKERLLAKAHVHFTENHRFKDSEAISLIACHIQSYEDSDTQETQREQRDVPSRQSNQSKKDSYTETVLNVLTASSRPGENVLQPLDVGYGESRCQTKLEKEDTEDVKHIVVTTNDKGETVVRSESLRAFAKGFLPVGAQRDGSEASSAEGSQPCSLAASKARALLEGANSREHPAWSLVLDALVLPYLADGGYVCALQRFLATSANQRTREDFRQVLRALESYRVLAVHRKGRRGVSGLNKELAKRIQQALLEDHHDKKIPTRSGHWRGEIILVTENAYDVGLRNGDVGVILPSPTKPHPLSAWFEDSKQPGGVREVALGRLPEHMPGFAMTVHKSQGSQFYRVALVLAERKSALQTRELVYTAITRSKKKLDWYGSEEIMRAALASRVQRASGLGELLLLEPR